MTDTGSIDRPAETSAEAAAAEALSAALAAQGGDLPPDLLVFGEEVPARNRQDWSRQPPVRPLALARPRSTAEVAAVLAACARAGLAVVPQGGLTGLVRGAHPVAGGVALSLERMTGVEEVDVEGATMIVRAGTPLHEVQAAADAAGLFFPLDLGSRGSCSIGGNVSTNAGGNRVIRYGTARDQVLGLEVVLPDGTVVNALNRLVKNNTGYDIKHLFIGAEGTLGVITRLALRLQPKPAALDVALCALPDYASLLSLLSALRARFGPGLTSFEAMWDEYLDTITSTFELRRPFAAPHRFYAIVEISRFGAGEDARLPDALGELMEEGLIEDALIAQTEREAADFWKIREIVGDLRQKAGPLVSYDIGLPAGVTDRFVETSAARVRAQWPDAMHLAYGHLGDNNLHLIVRSPACGTDQPREGFDRAIYDTVREFGGSISAEHGIGTTKRPYLGHTRSPEEIAVMRLVKRALDPDGRMNPGKVLEEEG
ncbi:FAD-binding oxidoreductase [Albimonas sp. CAU 1670]|uniref:FAD-binding oxidoreductase n=1 Tax=Albimonas sp. CAU 1670 TaxID=3032599 RepID=UPI0023DB8753|nr:FAD-binding oxidoreductase [Albimonas sp. CAU 1670]MDF2233621.1 FAD-binding oxidoreductase [Albimonas sp. CAU 1670]